MNREARERVALQTLDILNKGYYRYSDNKVEIDVEPVGKLYTELPIWVDAISGKPKLLEFTSESTITACQRLAKDKRVGVLNFASANNPGGGFQTGANAQEESIARASTLYNGLRLFMEDYYMYNRKCESEYYSDRVIYLKDVVVFRSDDGKVLRTPYKIEVLTQPAVNMNKVGNHHGGIEKMQERIRRAIQIFVVEGCKDIILGAYGCGVFKNKVENVARMFYKVIVEEGLGGYFNSIIFALNDEKTKELFERNYVRKGGI